MITCTPARALSGLDLRPRGPQRAWPPQSPLHCGPHPHPSLTPHPQPPRLSTPWPSTPPPGPTAAGRAPLLLCRSRSHTWGHPATPLAPLCTGDKDRSPSGAALRTERHGPTGAECRSSAAHPLPSPTLRPRPHTPPRPHPCLQASPDAEGAPAAQGQHPSPPLSPDEPQASSLG